jgi:P27 family predicted phage terminase small subunit
MARPRIDDSLRTSASARWDAKRDRTKQIESGVVSGKPKMPPEFVGQPEEAFWKGACKLLARKGTLAATDGPTLRLFADLSARQVEAKAEIKRLGLIYEEQRFSKGGDPYTVRVVNPAVKIATDAERQLLQLQKSLGITAVDREKVTRARPKPGSEPPRPGTLAALRPDLLKQIQKQGAN